VTELNYFDPPDAGANQAADLPSRGPLKRPPTKIKVTPDPSIYGVGREHPDFIDRRQQDFGDWEGGRFLDPTPFTHVMDESWRLPPGHYLAMQPPPLGTSLTDLQKAAGVGELDRMRAVGELRRGLTAMKARAK
jgi:hypothetical protein